MSSKHKGDLKLHVLPELNTRSNYQLIMSIKFLIYLVQVYMYVRYSKYVRRLKILFCLKCLSPLHTWQKELLIKQHRVTGSLAPWLIVSN